MPTLAVARDYLFGLLKQTFTKEQFEDLCFEFGIELDDVTSDREVFLRENGNVTFKGPKAKEDKAAFDAKVAALDTTVTYKIDTPANRYDLLCAEGMAIALSVFRGTMPAPRFKMLPPKLTVKVEKSCRGVRDFVVCAVLRNLTFTEQSYRSFIDYQDKLHSGLARKRTLASVGTHDLDKIAGPNLTYACWPRDKIQFVPLRGQNKVLDCTGNGLADYYAGDRHISKFVPYIADNATYPVILDQENRILSLPPIINSDMSKIDVGTKNMFIECTAPDHHKATVLVEQLVCAFSMYCAEPFEVERVNVVYEDPTALREALQLRQAARKQPHWTNTAEEQAVDVAASSELTPDMYCKKVIVDAEDASRRIGIKVDAAKTAQLLGKMQLHAEPIAAAAASSPSKKHADPEAGASASAAASASAETKSSTLVSVSIPPCRSDVLHPCDVIEDIAIAYGYDNIIMQETPTRSNGFQQPLNKLTHLLRIEAGNAGYTEMLTFSLCSRDEAFGNLGREDKDVAVHIANPQTVEFQVCRPSLLPGTLKTFVANKHMPLPLKFFEASDVMRYDAASRTGCRNERHFGALVALPPAAESAGFEDIQGLVELMLQKLGLHKKAHYEKWDELAKQHKGVYVIHADESRQAPDPSDPAGYGVGPDPALFDGRRVKLVLHDLRNGAAADQDKAGVRFGGYGWLHPRVLKAIDLTTPCSYAEFNLSVLLPFSA